MSARKRLGALKVHLSTTIGRCETLIRGWVGECPLFGKNGVHEHAEEVLKAKEI